MTAMTQVLSTSMEDYLEAIFLLVREYAVARSKEIAERLRVSRPSVTGALQVLRERGLVNYEPYGVVTLTNEGEDIAKRVLRRHEALRDFMINVLAVDAAEADEAACRMEHGISKNIVDRFVDFAEFVETCPRAGVKWALRVGYRCEKTVPSTVDCERCVTDCLDDLKGKTMKEEPIAASTTLEKLKPGEKGQIEKVAGNSSIKRRIRDMGMTNGSLVEVVRVAPMGDPIDVKVRGYHLSLRKEEAADIRVKKLD